LKTPREEGRYGIAADYDGVSAGATTRHDRNSLQRSRFMWKMKVERANSMQGGKIEEG